MQCMQGVSISLGHVPMYIINIFVQNIIGDLNRDIYIVRGPYILRKKDDIAKQT